MPLVTLTSSSEWDVAGEKGEGIPRVGENPGVTEKKEGAVAACPAAGSCAMGANHPVAARGGNYQGKPGHG